MKVEIILLSELQYEKVAFYTVGIHGKRFCEFDDFQKRMRANKKDTYQLKELNRFIEMIGNQYGAQDQYFKREGYAERLPGPTFKFIDSDGETDFGLRLYCIRLSDQVVILLNGDRKTAQRVKDCKNCKPHFHFANNLSNAIYKAKLSGDIEIDGFDILTEDNFILNI